MFLSQFISQLCTYLLITYSHLHSLTEEGVICEAALGETL